MFLSYDGDFHDCCLKGGKDAANERYLHTKLKPVARVLFPKADDALLHYKLEYGRKLEPTR